MLPQEVFEEANLVDSETTLQQRIAKALGQDESLEEILSFLRKKGPSPQLVTQGFRDYMLEGDLLLYWGKVLIPDNKSLKRDLIAAFHKAPSTGHLGQQQTLELISRHYDWPGIRARVYKHVESCEECQRNCTPKEKLIPL